MLEKEEYMPKSINKYLVCFRAMVGYAHKARLHDNVVAEKSFQRFVCVRVAIDRLVRYSANDVN